MNWGSSLFAKQAAETVFFFKKNFFQNFFKENFLNNLWKDMRDSRNDLGTLIGGQKGIKVNVLPTDRPTDGPTRWRIESLHATNNGGKSFWEQNFFKKFSQNFIEKNFFSKKFENFSSKIPSSDWKMTQLKNHWFQLLLGQRMREEEVLKVAVKTWIHDIQRILGRKHMKFTLSA